MRDFASEDAPPDLVRNYTSGRYWAHRSDMMYYHYVDYIVRTVGREAGSMIDVGSASSPFIERFDWIREKLSLDMAPPYASDTVMGIQGDLMQIEFARKFDLCTCLQVLEHIPDVRPFARKLLTLSDLVVVSVPFMWPTSAAEDHIHDPISYEMLTDWMGMEANYHIVVSEPFRGKVGDRLIAVYDARRDGGYGRKDFSKRVRLPSER